MVRTKQGLVNTSNADCKEERKGNSQILNAASPEQLKKLSYPAQVIVRPFNLVSNSKAKELMASMQMSRPKERYKYQHNVNGDVDKAKARDVVLPSTSQSPSLLKTLVFSTSGNTSETDSKNIRLTKTDILHSSTPTLVVNNKLENYVEGTLNECNPQPDKIPISTGKFVQGVCAGSVTVTNRSLKVYGAKKVLKVNSIPLEVPNTAGTLGVQHQTMMLQNSATLPSSKVSLPCSVSKANLTVGTSVSLLQRPQEVVSKLAQGGGSNVVQVGAKNKFQVVNTSVVNGQKFFVCKLLSDSPVTAATISTTTAAITTATTMTAAVSVTASVSNSIAPNNFNICPDNTRSVSEKCVTSTVSAVRTPQITASVSSLDMQKPNDKGIKTVHLEILEDRLVQLRKASSTQPSLENKPKALALNSSCVVSPPKQITEEQLQKLFHFKKSPNEPLKLIGIKSVKDVSNVPPLVLQPVKKMFRTAPELKPATFSVSSSSQDNVQLMNVTNEKQRKINPVSETLSTQLQQKNLPGQNTPDGKTAAENPQVLLQQKIDAQIYRKRKEIALKYQQEVERMKTEKKVVKRQMLPQRTVEVVDMATQTSLFSIIEPGRFVELSFTERTSVLNSKPGCISHEKNNILQKKSTVTSPVPSSYKRNEIAAKRPSSRDGTQDMPDSSYESAEETSAQKRMKMDNPCLERCDRSTSRIALQNINNTVPIFASSHCSNNNKNNNNHHQQQQFASGGNSDILSGILCSSNNNNINYNEQFTSDGNSDILSAILCSGNDDNKNNEQFASSGNSDILSGILSNSSVLRKLNRKQQEQILKDWKACVMADDVGNIPLHYAVMDGDTQEVKRQCLVLAGRNEFLDWVNKDDETPLHLAVSSGNVTITKILLAYKADPSERDAEGNTALHLAVGPSSNAQCLEAVLEHVQRGSELLDTFNDDGYSPLHLCVINSKDEEVNLLVEKGADVNSRDGKSGKTPLFHAVLAKNNLLACRLVRLGASTTTPNYSGQTPLSICEMSMLPSLEVACDSATMEVHDEFVTKKPILLTPGPSCGTQKMNNLPSSGSMTRANGLSKSFYSR